MGYSPTTCLVLNHSRLCKVTIYCFHVWLYFMYTYYYTSVCHYLQFLCDSSLHSARPCAKRYDKIISSARKLLPPFSFVGIYQKSETLSQRRFRCQIVAC